MSEHGKASAAFRAQSEEKLPDDVPGLEKRLAELEVEQQDQQQRIRELSAAENPAAGIFFAAEIHEARQYKMMLQFKKDYCRAKLNRLRLEEADEAGVN